MDNIGLKDILALAMKGYKLDEIKELVSLGNTVSETANHPDTTPDKKDPEPETPEQAEKPEKDKEEKAEDSEQLKAQIEELKEQIRTLQEEKTKQPVAGENKSDQEILDELVKTYI